MRSLQNTSFNRIQLVVFHHENGETEREIEKLLSIPRSTIGNIIRRYKNENRLELNRSTGRPRMLTKREQRTVIKKIKENPRFSAPKLADMVYQQFHKQVSSTTIRKVLHSEHGYNVGGQQEKNHF